MRESNSKKLEKLLAEKYPYEDQSLTDELNSYLRGNPNAQKELLAISGLKDWSLYEYYSIDEKLSYIKGKNVIHYSKLLDYVMDNYCRFSRDTLESKHIELSLMNSLVNDYILLYGLAHAYKNDVIFLYNVFRRLLSKVKPGGWIVIRSRF